MACIEVEQKCFTALLSILFDLVSGSHDSIVHSVVVWIVVALDLISTDIIGLDTLLKLVSPLSGLRHVSILEFIL